MNPLGALARKLGGAPWFPALSRRVVRVDTALQRRTGSRFSLMRVAGVAGLLLTTTGRRTGLPRTVPLLYASAPDGYVVAGSNWGGHAHPAWALNLMANPVATVAVRGSTFAVKAHLADGEERARLWDLLTAAWPAYDAYAERAGRDIRVFLLVPTGA